MRRIVSIVVCALAAPLAAAHQSAWPELEIANFIDARVFERLRELEAVPSQLAGDAEFLRRLSLTTIGQLPTPHEVRSFLADDRRDKRARKIDELVAHPLHAALWATRFGELTGNSLKTLEGPDALKPKRAKMWHDWLRKRFAENTPYDDLVRQILTATSRGDAGVDRWIDDEAALTLTARGGFDAPYAERAGFDLFWRREEVDGRYPAEEIAERVASSFLGVRINCARCHKHPFDRWTQEDYRAFAGIFRQVRFDLSPEVRSRFAERIDERRRRAAAGGDVGPPLARIREVYLAAPVPGAAVIKAKALGGPDCSSSRDPRVALMDWLNDPANPYFAKNIVNRVWAHHFGRGLVEPLDGFSADNAPSHAALIDELATDFIAHGYDLRRLETLILNSSSWQLSSEPNAAKGALEHYFSRALVRLPPAEAVLDMWLSATGATSDFGNSVPEGIRAVEIGPNRLGEKRWDDFLDLFGRSPRSETCDCGAKQNPSIRRTLALMCDTNLLADVSHGAHRAMLEAALRGESLVDEMFLRTLSRFPTGTERAAALDAIAAASNKHQAFEDLFWGLVNSQEFITNH